MRKCIEFRNAFKTPLRVVQSAGDGFSYLMMSYATCIKDSLT